MRWMARNVAKWYGRIDLSQWVASCLESVFASALLEEGMLMFCLFSLPCLFLFNLCSVSQWSVLSSRSSSRSCLLCSGKIHFPSAFSTFFERKDACPWRGSCISAVGPLYCCVMMCQSSSAQLWSPVIPSAARSIYCAFTNTNTDHSMTFYAYQQTLSEWFVRERDPLSSDTLSHTHTHTLSDTLHLTRW